MSREEARAEARRRWGANGCAGRREGWRTYYVGIDRECDGVDVRGEGRSWAEAFADADANERGQS